VIRAKKRCKRKVLYDLTENERITEEQRDLLSLGLNFRKAPTKLPILERIMAVEDFAQRTERSREPEDLRKAKSARDTTLAVLKNNATSTIPSNLLPEEKVRSEVPQRR
jgi:hypothetical protein